MPGQAVVTIRDSQWQVSIADTDWELIQGLGGIPEIPAGTGMFFDTGAMDIIEVTTAPMLFPIDIAFLSEELIVTEVYQNVDPGYVVTSTSPARYFLEVNAGELKDISSGDRASAEIVPLDIEEIPVVQQDPTNTLMQFMTFMVMMTFMTMMARDVVKAAVAPRKPKTELPPGYRRIPGRRLLWERSPQTEPEQRKLIQKWYQRGLEAGKTEGWMTLEETLDEARQIAPIHDYHDLVQTAIELWEETDHFSILYGSKMMDDAKEATKSTEDMIDLYLELRDQFWEGYLQGRKEKGIDIYHKAKGILSRAQSQTFMPQTRKVDAFSLPFSGATRDKVWWMATIGGRTVEVQVSGIRRLSERELESALADSVAVVKKGNIGSENLRFAMAREGKLKWMDFEDHDIVDVTVLGVRHITDRRLEDALLKSRASIHGPPPEYLPKTREARLMPKLPSEAKKDEEFVSYIRDVVELGQPLTEEEVRHLWTAWKIMVQKGYQPQTEMTVYCPICGKEVPVQGYDSITRTEALREHIQAEHQEGRERQKEYLPQTKEVTRLDGLRVVKAYKQVSKQNENAIAVSLKAWGIFPRGRKPHMISMYRSGDKYIIHPLYGPVGSSVEVPVERVRQWIRSLPIRHFTPMEVAPEKKEQAERLAREVGSEIEILSLSEKSQEYQPRTTYREELVKQILRGLRGRLVGRGENYFAYVKYIPGQAFATIGSIVGGHYSWNPEGFSVWVEAWEKDESGFGGIREIGHGRAFPATERGVTQALDYVEERFPNYTATKLVTNSVPIYVAQAVGIEVPQERIPRLPQTLPNLTREDVTVDAWQERDRLGIWVTDNRTDETIAEWWDEDAWEMFEQGFFKGGVPEYSWEKPSREFVKSVLDRLEDIGVLAKEEEGPAGPPVPEREGEFKVHEDRMGNIILEYSEEPDKDVLLQFEAEKAVVYDILTDEEQEELRSGWEVQVPAAKPRASVLEELWQYAEPKNMPQTQRPGLWKTPLNIDLDKKEIAHISKDLLKKGTPICRVNPHERWPKARYGTDIGIVFRVEEPVQRDTIVHGETDYIIGLASFKTLQNRRPDLLSLPMCAEGSSRTKRAPSTAQTRSYPMPKLPKEAQSDAEFVNYVRMIVRAGERLTDREATALWQKWKEQKKQTRQTSERYYPAVIKDALSRGERFVNELPEEARQDIDFLIALGILDASGKKITGDMARNLWEQWKSLPREQRAISPVAQTKTGGGQAGETRLVPTGKREREKSELKYMADSPEFLTQTVDLTGYREQIDKAFQEAIRRVKGTK